MLAAAAPAKVQSLPTAQVRALARPTPSQRGASLRVQVAAGMRGASSSAATPPPPPPLSEEVAAKVAELGIDMDASGLKYLPNDTRVSSLHGEALPSPHQTSLCSPSLPSPPRQPSQRLPHPADACPGPQGKQVREGKGGKERHAHVDRGR